MEETTPIEAPSNTEESIISKEETESVLQPENIEIPKLTPSVEVENKIDQEMPLLDEPPQLSAEEGPQIANNTNSVVENPTEITMELPQTTEVSETTTELSEPTVELPQITVEAAEEGNTSVELAESGNAEMPENIIETHSAEEVNTSNTEVVDVDNSDIVEIKDEDAPEGDKQEFTDGNTSNPDADFQITELSETEYTVEEVSMEQNTSGETTESAMEAENAVAQIIVPDEPVVEEQTSPTRTEMRDGPTRTEMEDGPTITEMEDDPTITEMEGDQILIENDVSFPSESQEESTEEANTSTEIPPNVEYHVVLNDSEVIAVNGMPQLTKEEEVGVYESEVINDVTISGSEVPNPETTAIISLPSDTVTEVTSEVTYTDVRVLETHEGLVTINDLNEQTEQEIVILQEDNVVVMETEEYDHPESIEVNVLDQNAGESEPKEEADQDQDETKPVKIPCHVLGRNIENPLEDPVRNGRVLLKPRLGVKIPYRNLTSQIVSKQEIADEIMERSRLRQSSAEPPAGGDVFFAKKLTQRLAKKLSSPTKTPTKSSTKTTASTSTSSSSTSSSSSSKKVSNSSSKTVSSTKSQVTPKPQTTTVAVTKVQASPVVTPKVPNNSAPKVAPPVDTSGKITDNSDLIALLEGDDDTEWPMMGLKNDASTTTQKKSTDSPKSPKKSSEWERETALKQLRELPIKSKYSSTKSGGSSKDLVLAPKSSPVSSPQNANKEPSKPEIKESAQKDDPLEELKDDLNVEPRFSSSSVMKTYTRKRKPSEDIKPFLSSTLIPSLKKAGAANEQKQSSNVSKSTTVSSQKQSSASIQKHSSTSPQKSSSQKSSVTSSTPKPSVTSSTPKSSSNVPGQKTIQKAPTVVQKSSSSSSIPKVSSSAAPKATSTPNLQKVTSAQKTADSEKKQQPVSVSDKKPTTAPPKSTEAKLAPPKSEETKPVAPTEQKKALSPNTYISKSSRIVKRKKIWDPDEATPAFKLSAIKSPKSQEVAPEKPAEKKVNKQVAVLKPSNEKKVEKPASPIPKIIEKKVAKPVSVLKPNNEKSPSKKVIMKKVIVKKKKPKRLTEVDRLLMDEGAVNLLYSVKNTEELQNLRKKKKKTVYSIDRAQRELLNKTNEIKNDLQINSTKDSPISLRKKDGTTPKTSPLKDLAATILQRKKSKDSISGSVHSPPASPGFGYAQHAEASRIIRRHSSSSFSSENMDTDENRVTEKSSKHKSSESPKKKLKSSHEKRGSAGIGIDKQLLNEEMSKNFNKAPDDPKYSRFETFCVRKFDNLCQIILATTSTNGQTTLSTQVLAELALVLDILQKDDSCRVVLISSSGNSFCQGIDYKEMVSDDKEERRSIAENFAVCVKNFLMSLSKFSKILVAGVHGNAIGLGVTMLPLFDMVLASDTATFCTPYAQLGCAAEGGVLLTLPHVMHNALASELFFASRKLTAAEALRLGLVTRTLWPDKFQEELISALKIISSQSLQSMQAIKKQLRHHLLQNVENSLKIESNTLIQHWTSTECQNNFSDYSLDSK